VAGADQCVGMVGHESQGVKRGARLHAQSAEAVEEAMPVAFRVEDLASLNPADDEVVQGTWVIEVRPTRQDKID
jgi:hypothetical protein